MLLPGDEAGWEAATPAQRKAGYACHDEFGEVMRYFVTLAYEPTVWSEASAETQARYHRAHLEFHEAVVERASLVAGEALAGADTATTLRHVDGRPTLTEGPFAEAAEVAGGFYLVDAPDLDTMTSLCELLPPAYSIEIRPCVNVEGLETH